MITYQAIECKRSPYASPYRYCDDGFKWPGHPDWFPTEPRRMLQKQVCTNGIRLAEGNGTLLVLGFLGCADAEGKRLNLYPDYRRVA